MNKFILTSLLIVGIFGFQGILKAADEVTTPAADSKAVEVGNKVCPVSGEKIEANSAMGGPVKLEYKGKIYNLCCPMCVKDFKKDPEKYSKIADDEAAKDKAK